MASANAGIMNRTNQVMAAFAQAGASNGVITRTSEGMIMLQTVLGTSQQYTWQVANNVNSNTGNLPTEVRVRVNDAFVPTKLGMYISKSADLTAGNLSAARFYTWPNPTVFNGSGEAANLEGLYGGNSLINFNLNNVDTTQFFATRPLRCVGMAQQGVQQGSGTNIAGPPATFGAWQADEQNRPDWGLIPFNGDCALNGSSNQKITLNMPAGLAMAGSTSNILTLVMWGVFLINGADYVLDNSLSVFISQVANTPAGQKFKAVPQSN